METITLSYLADLIIVCIFCGMIGAILGNVAGHIIIWIGEKIHAAIKNHREKARNKMEISSEEAEEK